MLECRDEHLLNRPEDRPRQEKRRKPLDWMEDLELVKKFDLEDLSVEKNVVADFCANTLSSIIISRDSPATEDIKDCCCHADETVTLLPSTSLLGDNLNVSYCKKRKISRSLPNLFSDIKNSLTKELIKANDTLSLGCEVEPDTTFGESFVREFRSNTHV